MRVSHSVVIREKPPSKRCHIRSSKVEKLEVQLSVHFKPEDCVLTTMLLWSSKWDCKWTASSEFDTYRPCEQRRFRRACASAQSRQNLCYSLLQAVSQEEPSDRKPDPWPLWMAGHVQLKFVMTELPEDTNSLDGAQMQMLVDSKHKFTQILLWCWNF